jgi:hypothetical protein
LISSVNEAHSKDDVSPSFSKPEERGDNVVAFHIARRSVVSQSLLAAPPVSKKRKKQVGLLEGFLCNWLARRVMLALDTAASFHELCFKGLEQEAIAWLSSRQGIDKVSRSSLPINNGRAVVTLK